MLHLILPNGYSFPSNDYGRTHSFKIFNEDETAFNATSYNAPIIHIIDQYADLLLELTGAWTTQASGIGSFAFTNTSKLSEASGRGFKNLEIQVQLEKSGEVTTTEGRSIFVIDSVD